MPSQHPPCAAPRRMSPGSAALSRRPLTAERLKHSQHLPGRVKRRKRLVGRGWEMCWCWSKTILTAHQLWLIIICVLWSRLAFQADKERKEAEEMQKELGLGDQDDSLVMMLQVTNIHAKFESGEGFVGHTSCLQPFWHSHYPATTEVQRAEF